MFRRDRNPWPIRVAILAWCLVAVVPGPGLRVCLPDTGGLHVGIGADSECPTHLALRMLGVNAASDAPDRGAEHVADLDDDAHDPCEDLSIDGQRDKTGSATRPAAGPRSRTRTRWPCRSRCRRTRSADSRYGRPRARATAPDHAETHRPWADGCASGAPSSC